MSKSSSKRKSNKSKKIKKSTAKSSNSTYPSLQLKLAGFVAIIGFLIYANTLGHDYAYDDFSVIKNNYIVKKGISGVGEILTTSYRAGYRPGTGELYRPLSLAVFALQWQIAPDSPALAHWTNVLLYGLTGFFLYLLLFRLFKKEHFLLPLFVALVFITHPLHTEVVANIKSLDELLAFLLVVFSFHQLWNHVETKKIGPLILSVAIYFLAILSKESTLTLIAVFPLLLYFFSDKTWPEIFKIAAYFIAPVVLYWVIRSAVLGGYEARTVSTSVLDNTLYGASNFIQEKASTFLFMGIYLYKLVIPYPLVSDLGYNQVPLTGLGDWRVLLSMVAYAGMFVFAILQFKRKSIYSFGILFFLLTFFIFSNLLVKIGSGYGERFMYIPLLGFGIVAGKYLLSLLSDDQTINKVDSIAQLFSTYKTPLIALAVISTLYSFQTINRNPAWKDSYTLYQTDAVKAPNSAKLRYHNGLEIMKTGIKFPDTNKKNQYLNNAVSEFNEALKIYPEYHDAFAELGLAYFRLGQPEKALSNYEKSLEYKANNYTVYSNMGIIYFQKNDLQKAREVYEKAVSINPAFVDARRNLGTVYAKTGKHDQAIEQFKEGLKYDPNNAILNLYLGYSYRDKGDQQNAQQYLNRAYQLDPSLKQ